MSAANVTPAPASAPLDVAAIRREFPVLSMSVHGKPLCYLDNAASSQRPQCVIDAVSDYYETTHANVHRGVHALSQQATDLFEGAREKLRRFVNARSTREVIFVRGTTEAINLVAQSYARPRLQSGDEILISWLEHHANIVPWQMVCEQTGAQLRVIPMTRAGEVDFAAFKSLLTDRTRLLALTHVSNALGTIVPVQHFIAEAHRRGVPVLLDGAQAVPHLEVDVQALDCDFYCFSGHKMCGPTGIGVLYGRESLLAAMPPWQGGGDMILAVSFERTIYNDLPYKFEAGTPHIAGAIGLGAAVDYLQGLGLDRIADAEHDLLEYATARLAAVPGLEIIGTAPREGRGRLVHDAGHPPARSRHDPRQRGRGDPHRSPLRDAGDGVLRRPGDGARLVRFLQHTRGDRSSRRCAGPGTGGARLMDLSELYRDVIVDHNRNPRNFRPMPGADSHAEGFNPLCGDRLTLFVKLDGDRISDVSFQGSGCAISVASASLLTESVKGRTIPEAERLFATMHALLTRDDATVDVAALGKLGALSGVREFPARVKCASLCWHTLDAALHRQSEPVRTE